MKREMGIFMSVRIFARAYEILKYLEAWRRRYEKDEVTMEFYAEKDNYDDDDYFIWAQPDHMRRYTHSDGTGRPQDGAMFFMEPEKYMYIGSIHLGKWANVDIESHFPLMVELGMLDDVLTPKEFLD